MAKGSAKDSAKNSTAKIYTKRGDQGQTTLVTGTEVSKTHPRLECYGALDELGAILGCAVSAMKELKDISFSNLSNPILRIQEQLFCLGSQLASDNPATSSKLPDVSESDIAFLETSIDEMQAELPELRNFLLAGGHPASTFLQLARTVCRRAERLLITLANTESIEKKHLKYINRLSDFLFVAARTCNQLTGSDEVLWKMNN